MELVAAALILGLCFLAGCLVVAEATRPFFRGIDRDEEDANTARFLILKQEIQAMSIAWDAIREEVNQNRDVIESAVRLIEGLAERVEQAATGDPADAMALAAELREQRDSLAAAVAANTPGAVSDATEPVIVETQPLPLDGETYVIPDPEPLDLPPVDGEE